MRAGSLATMAALAGFDIAVAALPDGARPDVLRARASDAAVFIGDAKATETPANTDTRQRLLRYMKFADTYVRAGGTVLFALAVPDSAHGPFWDFLLTDVTDIVRTGGVRAGRDTIDSLFCVVVWRLLLP